MPTKQRKAVVARRNGFHLQAKNCLQLAKEQLDLGTEADLEKMENICDKLSEYQKRIDALDQEICELCEDDEIEAEVGKATELQTEMVNCIVDLNSRIKRVLRGASSASGTSAGGLSENGGSQQGTVSGSPRVGGKISAKLPKLDITKYDGHPLKWREFWDAFESAIHSNESLSQVDRFNYLRSLLTGEAERAIRGIAITNANYMTAVDTIKERFGNEQTVVFAHFDELFRLPTASADTARLRFVYDECERHIRGLEALDVTKDKFSVVFVPLIFSKLPEELRVDLNRKNGCQKWELSSLRRLLKEEIMARELGERRSMLGGSGDRRSKPKPFNYVSTEVLLAGSSTRPVKCIFCEGNHFSDECKQFPDTSSRRLKAKDRCFACLRYGHMTSACQRPSTCFCCKGKHHRSLCTQQFTNPQEQKRFGSYNSSNDSNRFNSPVINVQADEFLPTSTLLSPGENVLMQTATADVDNPYGLESTKARILFDTGSQRTFITVSLMRKLKLKANGYENIVVATFGANRSKTLGLPTVKLVIHLQDGTTKEISANVTPTITCPIQRPSIDVTKYNILKELPLADSYPDRSEEIVLDLLLGNDHYFDFVGTERIVLSENLMLIRSKLGWIISGRFGASKSDIVQATSLLIMNSVTTPIELEKFWKLDGIGIADAADNMDDDFAVENFNRTVKFKNGRYEVTWPWKTEAPELPENYELARGRLKSLMHRISSAPDLVEKYEDTISEQLKLGIIEKVDRDTMEEPRRHYIPHHCVVNPTRATTKVRIVYDASAKSKNDNNSLNECLYRGPVLLHDLCGMLIRFRKSRIAMIADIEKAFLQVGLQVPDREVTRFLWLKDTNKPCTDSNLEIYRFRRVPFGVVSSPFLLGATVFHHLKNSNNEVAQDILKNIYVDNVLAGVDRTADANKFYQEAKMLFRQASMNLREWASNSEEFISKIAEVGRVKGTSMKVLGLHWDVSSDTLQIQEPKTKHVRTQTKREILHEVAAVFDPLGY